MFIFRIFDDLIRLQERPQLTSRRSQPGDKSCFQIIPSKSGNKLLSNKAFENGRTSLKWQATPSYSSSLHLTLPTGHHITGTWLTNGGVKFGLTKKVLHREKKLQIGTGSTSMRPKRPQIFLPEVFIDTDGILCSQIFNLHTGHVTI